jgi:hypothetical protein
MSRFLQQVREQKDLILFSISLYFGGFLVLNSVFRIKRHSALLIALPVAIILGLALGRLLRRLGRKPSPIRSELHPMFGEIRIFSDRWEATFKGEPFDGEIELSGQAEAALPTSGQVNLFESIRERFDSISKAALKALLADLHQQKPPFKSEDLSLESIYLGKDSFSIYFGVPSRRAEAPDGFYVDFNNFQVEEAGWVH